MKEIVDLLTLRKETIATMESCTGGFIVNEITNIPGASNVLKFSCVTYSNEYKIKMGVSKSVIDEYSVYSINTAIEMAKAICKFSSATYGIGVTGQLNRKDPNNDSNDYRMVYVCIFNSNTGDQKTITLESLDDRVKSKKKICLVIESILKEFIESSE